MTNPGTVILLHGFFMRPITMLPVERALRKAGFDTVAEIQGRDIAPRHLQGRLGDIRRNHLDARKF